MIVRSLQSSQKEDLNQAISRPPTQALQCKSIKLARKGSSSAPEGDWLQKLFEEDDKTVQEFTVTFNWQAAFKIWISRRLAGTVSDFTLSATYYPKSKDDGSPMRDSIPNEVSTNQRYVIFNLIAIGNYTPVDELSQGSKGDVTIIDLLKQVHWQDVSGRVLGALQQYVLPTRPSHGSSTAPSTTTQRPNTDAHLNNIIKTVTDHVKRSIGQIDWRKVAELFKKTTKMEFEKKEKLRLEELERKRAEDVRIAEERRKREQAEQQLKLEQELREEQRRLEKLEAERIQAELRKQLEQEKERIRREIEAKQEREREEQRQKELREAEQRAEAKRLRMLREQQRLDREAEERRREERERIAREQEQARVAQIRAIEEQQRRQQQEVEAQRRAEEARVQEQIRLARVQAEEEQRRWKLRVAEEQRRRREEERRQCYSRAQKRIREYIIWDFLLCNPARQGQLL
ncbi:hypothetical protein QAD02_001135 [Eretmocerus hayati]|uniref:Uncharacterized protein n=1 Tax=Eretmocerus hayati TaxID=131215 RepID=A0ACC2NFM1_9HYME|nr:hypothetical protein QAD02_001135 [Eretmocerus hayati]